ncbi:hypothetical protein C3941_06885 [Kaistia algarum]|uniref:glycine zipper domain-containing protein n=1 Tax=Kaistia algarum TaxID=2083279 RepID=UPI000CE8E632|nr:glycine zipper domain-containing protein [Kaistia algarum]MCX5515600.1 glycine zipper domain-containing protein [Kaistia algarum]PPE81009.1 hypothetical protein C3941_06885 [Kaistia algarum]
MKKIPTLVTLALLGAVAAGCSPTTGSRTGDGAVLGAAAGGAIGGLATGTWGGAAIGAGIGAVTGAIIADATGKCYWVDKNGRKNYVACR